MGEIAERLEGGPLDGMVLRFTDCETDHSQKITVGKAFGKEAGEYGWDVDRQAWRHIPASTEDED